MSRPEDPLWLRAFAAIAIGAGTATLALVFAMGAYMAWAFLTLDPTAD